MASADLDLTTEADMVTWLRANGYPHCSHLTRLSGGSSAHTYRAHLTLDESKTTGPASIVVKHVTIAAGTYLLPLDPDRLAYDYAGLQLLSRPEFHEEYDSPLPSNILLGTASPSPSSSSTRPRILVRAPRPLSYDPAASVLAMEDVGALSSVKDWCKAGVAAVVAARLGAALGNFLARVHRGARGALVTPFASNTAARKLSAQLYFGGLPAAAERWGFASETKGWLGDAAAAGATRVLEREDVLTLGDFWTGNVLIDVDEARDEVRLFPVDFELMKPGPPDFDLGQMAAEMAFLAARRDRVAGEAMLQAFFTAYRSRRGSESERVDAAAVAMRMGAHTLIVVPWAWLDGVSEEEVQTMLEGGREQLQMGWTRDEAALRGSAVGELMR